MSNLPVSRIVRVSVNLTASPAQSQSLSDLLILGNSNIIDVSERMRTYPDLTSIGIDFGSTAPEYLAARNWFSQRPQPTQVLVGRWAQTAVAGLLRGATISGSALAIATWNAIASGGMTVTVDGVVKNLTALNFSAAANLNAVAAIIDTALVGATVVWDAASSRFTVESGTTGTGSTLTFATAPGSGTDISALAGLRSTSSGAYIVGGIASESANAAAAIFEDKFSQKFYALNMPTISANSDHLAVAAFIEATGTKHVYCATTQEAGVLVATNTTDLAYLMSQQGFTKSLVQYSSSDPYCVTSYVGRILTTNYNANKSVITMKFKDEPGQVAENLSTTQANALEGKNCNVFVNYNNGVAIVEQGVMCSGDFTDIIFGADWYAVELQTEGFNALYTSPTKIPQTDGGNHTLLTVFEGVSAKAESNGFLAAGTWESDGFGTLNEGDFMPKGYYIYAPPISSQNQTDRAARKSVPFQIAAKLAGAIHSVDLSVTINR